MKIYHDTQANGAHLGHDKIIQKITECYYWSTMKNNIRNYIKSCIRYNQNNAIRRKAADHLKSIEPPSGVWQLLSMNFHRLIVPTSQRSNKYIISITNILFTSVIAKAIRDCIANTAARFL